MLNPKELSCFFIIKCLFANLTFFTTKKSGGFEPADFEIKEFVVDKKLLKPFAMHIPIENEGGYFKI